MQSIIKDMIGFKVARLKVIARGPNTRNGNATWICECVCGKRTKPIEGGKLRSGRRKSCGCIMRDYRPSRAPKAGMGVHPFVRKIWDEMAAQQVTMREMSRRSLTGKDLMLNIREGKTRPRLDDIEAMLGVLGYKIELRQSE